MANPEMEEGDRANKLYEERLPKFLEEIKKAYNINLRLIREIIDEDSSVKIDWDEKELPGLPTGPFDFGVPGVVGFVKVIDRNNKFCRIDFRFVSHERRFRVRRTALEVMDSIIGNGPQVPILITGSEIEE